MWEALFLLAIGGGPASADCRVTLKASNAGARAVVVVWEESHVRIRTGWWTKLGGRAESRIAPGGEALWVYETEVGCAAERRWRFFLRRSDGHEQMLYVPRDSFTASTTVDLGDVHRVF